MTVTLKKTGAVIGKFANMSGLIGVCLILMIAFYYQLVFQELPCPLCLLQRLGFMLIGFGFLLNIRFGVHERHYGLVILGAMLTAAISARQILLHITPGDSGYGSTFLGVHFYTWSFVAAIGFLMAVALLLIVRNVSGPARPCEVSFLEKASMVLFATMVVGNFASVLLECGTGQCEDNPLFYEMLVG